MRFEVTIERPYIVYAQTSEQAEKLALRLVQAPDAKVVEVRLLDPIEAEAHGPEVDRVR